MKLQITARGMKLSTELRDYVERRVHFNLGRFAGKVRALSIRLGDINGPRGGIDNNCDVRVDLGPRRAVIVNERQAGIHTAVAFALDRAERAVERQLKSLIPPRGAKTVRSCAMGD